jgi:hypothetical protein
MARGSPDYNLPDYSFFTVETPVSDVVAERQGFSRLDNRGRVLWFEDWRNGLARMTKDYDSVPTQVKHLYRNGYGVGFHGLVELDPLANSGFASVSNGFMLPVSKRIGLEFSFLLGGQSGQLSGLLNHNYDGTNAKASRIQVAANGASIAIHASDGDHTIFTPSLALYLQVRFVSVKFVIDVEQGKYVRAMLGNTQYDLSNYSLSSGGVGLSGDTYVQIGVEGSSAINKNPVDIAYIIISGDEP